jgi:hypothetical protein
MSRVLYLGGFGNGRASVEGVGSALEKHFEEVDVLTFSDYVKNPQVVQRASKNVHLITHSAGALAIADASISPHRADLLNPPLRSDVPRLIARTIVKQARMIAPGMGVHHTGDIAAVVKYSAGSLAELAAHPLANLGNLSRISRFDSVQAAIQARQEGVYSRVLWTEDDAYFKPTAENITDLHSNGIRVEIVPGEHDEVVLRPQNFVDQMFATDLV